MASQYTIQECKNGYVLTHSYETTAPSIAVGRLSTFDKHWANDTYVFKYAQELTRKLEELMAGD
jgi:hypothetical protein